MLNDIEQYCINYSNFVKIGYGAFATVYRAKDNKNGSYVAIKEIIKEKFSNSKELIENEIKMMKKLKNENSVNLIDLIESKSHYYIIMEYCEYNLFNYMNVKKKAPLSIKEIKTVQT